MRENTSLDTDVDPLPANAELFVEKYKEIMGLRPGIASESIQGLSQSFSASDIGALIRQYASSILGDDCLTFSDIKVMPAVEKWVY